MPQGLELTLPTISGYFAPVKPRPQDVPLWMPPGPKMWVDYLCRRFWKIGAGEGKTGAKRKRPVDCVEGAHTPVPAASSAASASASISRRLGVPSSLSERWMAWADPRIRADTCFPSL